MKLPVIALFIAPLFAPPATAQREFDPDRVDRSEIGTRFKLEEEPVGMVEMRRMQKRIARCSIGRDTDLVREFLQKSDSQQIEYRELSVHYDDFLERIDFGNCLARAMPRNARMMQIRFTAPMLRNLLAEEIYLTDNKKPLTINPDSPKYLDNRFYVGHFAYPEAEVPARMADCIIYHASADAHAFIKSKPTSSKERKAAETLEPTINKCLPEGTDEVKFTVSRLRSYIADGLWSRSYYSKIATGTVNVEGGQ